MSASDGPDSGVASAACGFACSSSSLGVALIAASCTSSTTSTGAPPSTVVPPTSTVPPSPTGATLADGTPLPSGCGGQAVTSETVAFVADGRAWALDPEDGTTSRACSGSPTRVVRVRPAGRPRPARRLEVQGVSGDAPTWPPDRADADRVRLGAPVRPRGRVRVAERGAPRSGSWTTGKIEQLSTLPNGTYAVDRVPPERARARLHRRRRDSARASGSRATRARTPQRFVFSQAGHDVLLGRVQPGRHEDLVDRAARRRRERDPLDGPRGSDRSRRCCPRASTPTAHGLAARAGRPADGGDARCVVRRRAGDGGRRRTAPTRRWPRGARTDARARLARRDDAPGRPGGCGQPETLFAVAWSHGTGTASALVDGVTIGAPRTVLRDAPTEVPTPPNQAPPAPPGGRRVIALA